MLSDKILDTANRYLNENYPVKRVKFNGKFKRTIILDDGTNHILSDPRLKYNLKLSLFSDIEIIFGLKPEVINKLLTTYLNL